MPKTTAHRLVILHKNVKNVIAKITNELGSNGINIANLSNQSKGDFAVTLIDADDEISDNAIKEIVSLSEVIKVRYIK